MKAIKRIIYVLVCITLFLILSFNIYNFISIKVLNKDFAIISGYTILEVVSDSMYPTIKKGDLIIIDTKEKDYKSNDIITFYDENKSLVTHRLISIEKEKIQTKGDNNDSLDNRLPIKNIVGKYQFKITGLGVVMSSLKSPITLIMIFVIGLLIVTLISTDENIKPLDEEIEKIKKSEKKKVGRTKKTTKKVEKIKGKDKNENF